MGARYNWIAVRTAFVVKRWSYQKCADEFGIDVTTIKKRGSKEHWKEERDRTLEDGKSLVAQELLDEARATTDAATNAATEAAAERAKTDHQIAERLRGLIEDAIADVSKIEDPLKRIAARNAAMLMGTRFLGVNRVVQGITAGQPSDTADAARDPEAAAASTAAPVADIDDDGESVAYQRRFVIKAYVPPPPAAPPLEAAG